jgi:adsorption protein B
LRKKTAVFLPAWQESGVVDQTIRHMLHAWPQRELMLYVGCYRNDPETISAAMAAAAGDGRVRVVVHDRDGPTTKADCLNRLYAALAADERRRGTNFANIVLHDAEDMVHPAALAVIDQALEGNDFVQLPVRPEPYAASRWIAGHYADEFAEAHAKTLVVRDAVGAALPAAGVGCGFSRAALEHLCEARGGGGWRWPVRRGMPH